MTPVSVRMKIFFINVVSRVFGGFPIYVKDGETDIVTVKRARPVFDPFTNESRLVVKFRKYGFRDLNLDGTIGGSKSWLWQHVDPAKHAMHVLQNK